MSTDHIIKTQREQIYTTGPQKPILGLCQGHTRVFKVHKNGIHMLLYKAAKRPFPSHCQEMFHDEKAVIV